jgi:hypothetical protein
VVYFLLHVNRSSWSRAADPRVRLADDFAAEDYPTPGSRPTDYENLLDIAVKNASALLYMHVDEPCTTYFKYLAPLLYMFISVYILWASRCMCWDGNSGSWHEWDKTGRRSRFWVLWELEATDLRSGTRVHSLVYPYCDAFRSLGVGVLLALWGHDLASVWNRVGQPLHGTLRTHHLVEHGVRAELSSASANHTC